MLSNPTCETISRSEYEILVSEGSFTVGSEPNSPVTEVAVVTEPGSSIGEHVAGVGAPAAHDVREAAAISTTEILRGAKRTRHLSDEYCIKLQLVRAILLVLDASGANPRWRSRYLAASFSLSAHSF